MKNYYTFVGTGDTPLSGKTIRASSTSGDHTNGKHGIAKDRRGAKKFIRTRTRFHENAATRKLLTEEAP